MSTNNGNGNNGGEGNEVRVICGANDEKYPLAGKTVAEVLSNPDVAQMMSMPESPQVRVNGEDVGRDYKLESGDSMEIYKPSGDKGL